MELEILQSLAIGIGLAAACGLRVFVPPLVLSLAALNQLIEMPPDYIWLASPMTTIALAIATLIEIAAYYIPWLDNALDVIATPFAIIAGTLMMAVQMVELDPVLKWSVALIAGGGAAGITQLLSVIFRALSSTFTAGFGNAVVSTAEGLFAILSGILAIVAPYLGVILIVLLIYFMAQRAWQQRQKWQQWQSHRMAQKLPKRLDTN